MLAPAPAVMYLLRGIDHNPALRIYSGNRSKYVLSLNSQGIVLIRSSKMASYPVFLSAIYVVRNQVEQLESIVKSASTVLESLVSDYEIIIVDNASTDESITELKRLTGKAGYPNVQVMRLRKRWTEILPPGWGLKMPSAISCLLLIRNLMISISCRKCWKKR